MTILEVDAVDFSDAANVAEEAVKRGLLAVDVSNSKIKPVRIEWEGYNRYTYSATVVRQPIELSRGARNGDVNLTVDQPKED
jgi:hypothetical protein